MGILVQWTSTQVYETTWYINIAVCEEKGMEKYRASIVDGMFCGPWEPLQVFPCGSRKIWSALSGDKICSNVWMDDEIEGIRLIRRTEL